MQPIFITLDPQRNTAERLAEYVSSFHPRLIGLTGAPDDIGKLALACEAYYPRKANGPGEDDTIAHTGVTYLVGREGQYLGFVPPQTSPGRLTDVIRGRLGN